MALNGISTLVGDDPVTTKKLRREQKLALAAAKRSAVGTNGYRELNKIAGTHTQYVGTTTTSVSGSASPTPGHPWTK